MCDWKTLKTQKQWREELTALLMRNDQAVEKAVVTIYSLQTFEEQDAENTIESNGVGFTAFDAELMSSFAKQLLDGKRLSIRQMVYARKAMPKYWRQLMQEAKAKLVAA